MPSFYFHLYTFTIFDIVEHVRVQKSNNCITSLIIACTVEREKIWKSLECLECWIAWLWWLKDYEISGKLTNVLKRQQGPGHCAVFSNPTFNISIELSLVARAPARWRQRRARPPGPARHSPPCFRRSTDQLQVSHRVRRVVCCYRSSSSTSAAFFAAVNFFFLFVCCLC